LREGRFYTSQYVPDPSKKLKRNLQNNGLRVALKSSNILSSFPNSGKDLTSVEYKSGVYEIPCTCGRSYVGNTNQNLKIRLLEHQESMPSTLKLKSKLKILHHLYLNSILSSWTTTLCSKMSL